VRRSLIAACALSWLVASTAAAQKPPKVFVSVDMEGIWGVVASEQVSSASPEYAAARRWMAEDVNAVITGLLEGGAGEIVVNDSHGSMRNIVADALNPKASLISGSPKPLSMMQGIDSSFDAAVFVGYHARAGTTASVLDHTISSSTIRAVRVNGQELPEMGINAAIAAYYKVPVILLTGDGETCRMAGSLLGDSVVTAAVKEGIGRTAARMLPADEARKRLQDAAREALGKRSRIEPFRLTGPYTFDVEFHNAGQAELPSLLPNVKRTNPRGVTFTASDYIEGFKLLRAIIALAGVS
jgi:D-amino peptidase